MRQRAHDNRGIALVEAAFVTPVFFSLILGVAEIGLAMNDSLALNSAVRASARVASTSGADIYSDWTILSEFHDDSTALDEHKIQQIVIYHPASFGAAPTASCQAGTPAAGVCNTYTYTDMSRPKTDFGCLSTKNLDRYWCPSSRKTTLATTGTDYVGVWVKIQHPWLTKAFGNTKTMTESSVIRIEPTKKS